MNEQFNNSNLQHGPEFSAQITNQHILAFNRLSQAGVRLVSHQIPGSGIITFAMLQDTLLIIF